MRRGLRRAVWVGVTAVFLASSGAVAQSRGRGPADEVDPYIGVDWGGNTFVGAAVPFGMVKVGPDMATFDGRPSGFGYSSNGTISGFSHLHLSGAQGKYGNILVQPVVGPVSLKDWSSARSKEVAKIAYYATTLDRYGVKAELTSSRRVGVHRYTFPASDDAHILVDLAHCLSGGTGWESQHFMGGELKFTSDREVEGMGRYTGGWNRGGEYRVYFAMVLDKAAVGEETWTDETLSKEKSTSITGEKPIGAVFHLKTKAGEVVRAKVGISFLSTEQAKKNIASEVPGWDFDGVRASSVALWNGQFAALELPGVDPVERQKMYTAIYHTMLMPTDRTGENPLWQSSEPYYDDYYAIWDTFRSSSPLLTLIAPERERDIVRSLIDIYRHAGYMPDARSGNDNGRTQGGSNANVVIADAWVKKMGGIDYETAFKAMLHDANDPPKDAQKEGRGGLRDYNTRGYVTLADERSGSRTVEYAYDDFAIAEVACGLGKRDEAKVFAARTHNFESLWDADLSEGGFKGFLRPRNADGSWAPPNTLVRGTWPNFFYEGDEWTYSLYAPQDMRRLIAMAGGNDTFVKRLDTTFLRGHFDVTNEPGFLVPVMYNWAGRPDKTADIVHLLLEKYFTAGRAGIPGNDDSGAMSSWFLFHKLGFYPVAGQDVYVIGTPGVAHARLKVAEGKTLEIVAENFDAEGLNRYVLKATLNGKPLTRSWFRHDEIVGGGKLVLTMGSAPSEWGRAEPPPSMSDAGAQMLCAP